jgi:ornithine cyclodeaminase/alanine dehydrogenase-like protein (mu-crystallin family)
VKVLVLSRLDIETLLDLHTAIELVEKAMRALSSGETRQILRHIMSLPGSAGALGAMLGSLGAGQPFGLKCIAAFSSSGPGQSSHRGAVLLFDPSSGEPVSVIEAGTLTAIRTAAATAVATKYLARPSARTLGVLGAGEQARWHVPALLAVRRFDEAVVWARSPEKLTEFTQSIERDHGIRCTAAKSAEIAASADVVCTLTSSSEPILKGAWLRPGTHVNLVGSSTAKPCEVDEECVARSRYFVDWEESARAQASEFLRALRAGVIKESHLRGEIGAVANGTLEGRRAELDITLYKSLGVIVQDLVCGWHVYQGAKQQGMGSMAEF